MGKGDRKQPHSAERLYFTALLMKPRLAAIAMMCRRRLSRRLRHVPLSVLRAANWYHAVPSTIHINECPRNVQAAKFVRHILTAALRTGTFDRAPGQCSPGRGARQAFEPYPQRMVVAGRHRFHPALLPRPGWGVTSSQMKHNIVGRPSGCRMRICSVVPTRLNASYNGCGSR